MARYLCLPAASLSLIRWQGGGSLRHANQQKTSAVCPVCLHAGGSTNQQKLSGTARRIKKDFPDWLCRNNYECKKFICLDFSKNTNINFVFPSWRDMSTQCWYRPNGGAVAVNRTVGHNMFCWQCMLCCTATTSMGRLVKHWLQINLSTMFSSCFQLPECSVQDCEWGSADYWDGGTLILSHLSTVSTGPHHGRVATQVTLQVPSYLSFQAVWLLEQIKDDLAWSVGITGRSGLAVKTEWTKEYSKHELLLFTTLTVPHSSLVQRPLQPFHVGSLGCSGQ